MSTPSQPKAHATEQARQAVTWAAGTLALHGYQLHPVEGGWDVELPDGSWVAANDWRELCEVARAALTRGAP